MLFLFLYFYSCQVRAMCVCPVILHSQLLCFTVAIFMPVPNITGLRSKNKLNTHKMNKIIILWLNNRQSCFTVLWVSYDTSCANGSDKETVSVEAALSDSALSHPFACSWCLQCSFFFNTNITFRKVTFGPLCIFTRAFCSLLYVRTSTAKESPANEEKRFHP